jgi:hypothetical protein
MEQWYLVIDKNTGELFSSGTVIPDEKDRNPDYDFVKVTNSPPEDKVWDTVLRSFVDPPPLPPPPVYLKFINDPDIKALPKATQDIVNATLVKVFEIKL